MWFFSDEHRMLQETARQFAVAELAPRIEELDNQEGFNRAAIDKLGELGLLGVLVKEEDGGAGLDAIAATIAMEEIGAVDASTALSYLAHSILCVNQIAMNGTPEQRRKYLPDLVSGKKLGDMGMSEPGAGSDALGMTTRARKDGSGYVLTGTKTWITNGPGGDLFYVYARTGQGRNDISTFIVEKTARGFSAGKKFSKMGMRASPTGELVFEDVRVPESDRVGAENGSVRFMMRNLDIERITISGISLGIARASLEVAARYSTERKAFGKPIGAFQQIQERLAEGSAWYEACRSLTYCAAKLWDLAIAEGAKPGDARMRELTAAAGRAKLQSAQMATQVALDAIQILGGYGYTREFPVERYMRDAKLMEIGAGTNEIMRLVIARQMLGSDVADA
jgi:isovaleryl-CoA dehydrogenase